MITEAEYVKKMLTMGGYSLVLCAHGRVYTSEEEGITPLLATAQSGESWENAYAALRTLGKAEALLLLYLKVKSVYSETACKPALRLLEQSGVEAEFKAAVANFLNEEKTGLSRTEAAVAAIDNPADALEAIRNIL